MPAPAPIAADTPPSGFDVSLARTLAPRVNDNLASKGIERYDRSLLKQFQRAAGISQDGLYGGGSRGALIFYGIPNPPRPFFKPVTTSPYPHTRYIANQLQVPISPAPEPSSPARPSPSPNREVSHMHAVASPEKPAKRPPVPDGHPAPDWTMLPPDEIAILKAHAYKPTPNATYTVVPEWHKGDPLPSQKYGKAPKPSSTTKLPVYSGGQLINHPSSTTKTPSHAEVSAVTLKSGNPPKTWNPQAAMQLAPSVVKDLVEKGRDRYNRALLKKFQTYAGIASDGLYGGGARGALDYYYEGQLPNPFFKPTHTQPYPWARQADAALMAQPPKPSPVPIPSPTPSPSRPSPAFHDEDEEDENLTPDPFRIPDPSPQYVPESPNQGSGGVNQGGGLQPYPYQPSPQDPSDPGGGAEPQPGPGAASDAGGLNLGLVFLGGLTLAGLGGVAYWGLKRHNRIARYA